MGRKMKDSGIEWIGEIPEDWETVPLKRLCSFEAGKTLSSNEIEPEGDYKVYGGNGLRGYYNQYNHEGDSLLVGRQGALCGNVHKVSGKFWVTEHAWITTKTNLVDAEYLFYLLKGMNLNQYASNAAAQPGLSVAVVASIKTVLPSKIEQEKIVHKIKNIYAIIDKLIVKNKELIDIYKSLKQSLITQAVTKGIRLNRPMKDSGIDWIGEVPENWDVKRVKFLFKLRNERNFLPLDEVNLISLYTDKGVMQHDDIEKTSGNKASNADGYKKVYKGDIVVNIILCWMGAIGRSDYDGVTSPAYDVYIPNIDVDSRFYHHYFRTTGFNGDCYKRGRGIMAMRWRTYAEQFMDIKVVYPPYEEQKEILHYLDEKCTIINTLIAQKEKLLTELESYKKSLIYEYVTGKKEVPVA